MNLYELPENDFDEWLDSIIEDTAPTYRIVLLETVHYGKKFHVAISSVAACLVLYGYKAYSLIDNGDVIEYRVIDKHGNEIVFASIEKEG